MFASLIALAANIGLNFLLVPFLGITGAAVSNTASMFLLVLFTFFISRKIYPIRYEYGRLIHQSTFFLALLLLSFLISIDSIGLALLLKAFLIACFPLTLYLTGFFNQAEINKIKGILRSNFPFKDNSLSS